MTQGRPGGIRHRDGAAVAGSLATRRSPRRGARGRRWSGSGPRPAVRSALTAWPAASAAAGGTRPRRPCPGVRRRAASAMGAGSSASRSRPAKGTWLVTSCVLTLAEASLGTDECAREVSDHPGAGAGWRDGGAPRAAHPRRVSRLPRHRAGLGGGLLRPALAPARSCSGSSVGSATSRTPSAPTPSTTVRRRDQRRTPRGSSPRTVIADTLRPTVEDVLNGGRFDLISLGFLLSLWSGSRALNVFVDTISIMYGQSGVRGIIQTRALSFSLYAPGRSRSASSRSRWCCSARR